MRSCLMNLIVGGTVVFVSLFKSELQFSMEFIKRNVMMGMQRRGRFAGSLAEGKSCDAMLTHNYPFFETYSV